MVETLAEAESLLADFQTNSKELEEEMGKDLDQAEKAKEEMKNKLSRAETDRDDWKNKFMNLQTTHTKTVTSLQRELEALRESLKITKIQLRDLEMGNDDLERHERAVLSSLEDLEGKYARALEEKILLEHELQDRASMEETLQRLRDELRDTTSEVSVLKEKLERAEAAP
ncbi:hypothetical protein BS47DRAFT_242566 [Hydnum rufescens UP504]|uniref:NUDE domain-containing protein n=1 Tax=Hydnum rufescens UP504 TaxID=1448309 RepID=A0A9P6AM19_9AGAM|nr:hypothetical protein BS47DRAFT_242566 [Hydnum rufescens UP504]